MLISRGCHSLWYVAVFTAHSSLKIKRLIFVWLSRPFNYAIKGSGIGHQFEQLFFKVTPSNSIEKIEYNIFLPNSLVAQFDIIQTVYFVMISHNN